MKVKINELMATVAAADLTTDNGAATLEAALLEDFRARDLNCYFDFAYQYNAPSDQKQRHDKLIRRLRDTYAKYIDRAADLGIDGATKHGDFIEVDAPDGSELCPTLLDRPLGSIVREVKRKEARREGKIIEAINDIKRGQDDVYAQNEGIREDTQKIIQTLDPLKAKIAEPRLLEDLDPERIQKDAMTYCARLVAHVWANLGKTKRTAVDYVFIEARDGDRLFADCNLARTYQQKYDFSTSSVMTNAAKLHAAENHFSHGDGLERPESMREAAKKSQRKEAESIKKANGKRR